MNGKRLCVWAMVCACGGLMGCGGGTRTGGDAVMDLRNPNLRVQERVEAVDRAWKSGSASPTQRDATRSAMKDLLWSSATPLELRQEILAKLLGDPDPAGAADARVTARLMLPREQSRAMVFTISNTAAERGWTEFIPALIRSYSRDNDIVTEDERSERLALRTLAPDRPIEEIAYELFLNPNDEAGIPPEQWKERMRADAWDLLARLDKRGDARRRLLDTPESASGETPLVVTELRRSLADLHAIPTTGDQLRWLMRLRGASRVNQAWWGEAAGAIAALPPEKSAGLELRHAEAIRFATAHRPALIAASREELLSSLERALEDRETSRRSQRDETTKPPPIETLEEWGGKLTWADLVTIHLLDEAVRAPEVAGQLFVYMEMDRKDRTSEYGGIVAPMKNGPVSRLGVQLFPPRPGQRISDSTFVASDDMLAAGDTAIAHYHFHAMREDNRGYSGPSYGDLEYADRFGRACLVVTSTGEGRGNVDYYQPGGVVLDLGTIEAPAR